MKTITTIPSAIAKLQSEALVSGIKAKVVSGILTKEEATEEIAAKILELQSKEIPKLYSFSPFYPGKANSEKYNQMITSVSQDIYICFQEINNLFLKIQQYRNAQELTQKSLEKKIIELESEIETIKLEEQFETAYDTVFLNSLSNKAQIGFSDRLYSQLARDEREKSLLLKKHVATIDEAAGILTLPQNNFEDIRIVDVKIVETETTDSAENISSPFEHISNLIDEDYSKIWTYNIASKSKVIGGAKLVLEFDFGDKKDISQLDLEINSDYPLILDRFISFDEIGNETVLIKDRQVIKDKISLLIPRVTTRRIRGYFYQDNAELLSVSSQPSISKETKGTDRIDAIKSIVTETIKDPISVSTLPFSTTTEIKYNTYFNYSFGFRSITVKNKVFAEKGIFVSQKYETKRPTVISLDCKQKISTLINAKTQFEFAEGSVEYYIIKKDLDTSNRLLSSVEFPILPLGQKTITKEKGVFSTETGLIRTLFPAHAESGLVPDLKIYRNGEELSVGVDWRFSNRVGDDFSMRVDPEKNYTEIEILHNNFVKKNGVYELSYTPKHLIEKEQKISYNGIQYDKTNATKHSESIYGTAINRTELYLKIILRSNSERGESSPFIDYYKILTR